MKHLFITTQNSTGQDEKTQSRFQTQMRPCPKISCLYGFGLSLTQIPGMVQEVDGVPPRRGLLELPSLSSLT